MQQMLSLHSCKFKLARWVLRSVSILIAAAKDLVDETLMNLELRGSAHLQNTCQRPTLSILVTAAKDLVEDAPVNIELASEDLLIDRVLAGA